MFILHKLNCDNNFLSSRNYGEQKKKKENQNLFYFIKKSNFHCNLNSKNENNINIIVNNCI